MLLLNMAFFFFFLVKKRVIFILSMSCYAESKKQQN